MDITMRAIWCFIFIGYIFRASEANKYFQPRILNNKRERTVDANTNLILKCQGSQPVTWTYSYNTKNDWSTVHVSVYEETDSFGALLILTNASYVDTGFYYCHEKSAAKDDPSKSDSIYIYVRDEHHLALSDATEFIPALEYSTVTLKCLPTSPDVSVTLVDESDSEVEVQHDSFDPRYGFNITVTSLHTTYSCIFRRGDQVSTKTIYLIVHDVPIPKPTIIADNNGRISLNETLVLNCTIITTPEQFDMEWFHNGTEITSDGRVTLDEAYEEKRGVSILTIKDVQYEDNGVFTCVASDYLSYSRNATINVTVYGIGDSYINLTEEHGMYDLNVTANTDVIWNVRVDAFPKVELTWFNDKDENIEESDKNKYDIAKSLTETRLGIYAVDYKDAGVYQLRAKNNYEEKLINFTLVVRASEANKYFAPKILNNKRERTVDANTNLTLKCQGSQPVTWTYPSNTVKYDNDWSTVHVSANEATDSFEALLILTNASYVDTGFYYCHEKSAAKDDPSKSDSIYIYVRDEHHLALSDATEYISALEYSSVTLKCLPTSPDVIVTIFDTYGSEVEVQHDSFDPRYGFNITVTSVNTKYGCVFRRGDEVSTKTIFVVESSVPMPKPTIIADNNGRISLNETLVLKCTVIATPEQFGMKWFHNGTEITSDRRVALAEAYELTKNEHRGVSILTIKDVQYKDNGVFTCVLYHKPFYKNNATINVTVYGIGDSYINLTEEHGMYDLNVTANTDVMWNVRVDAVPKVELTWFNDKDEIIEESDKNKYDIGKNFTETRLGIYAVDYKDAGVYQLRAKNNYEEKSINFTLVVRGKPTVEIKCDNYHKYGEESSLICTAGGYPIPTLSWWYKPCLTDQCDFVRLPPENYTTNKREFAIYSVLTLTASKTGYVKCNASNNEGTNSSTVGFFLTDLDNMSSGFNAWGLVDNVAIAVGDNKSIHCAASVYNYTSQIDWYICNNTDLKHKIMSDDKFDIIRSETNFTYRITMTINSITKNESGDYCCVVKPIYLHNDTIRVMSIDVRDVQIPKIVHSNMHGTDVNITLGQPIDLICNAEGIPAPTIKWTKNGEDWPTEPSNNRITLSADKKNVSFYFTQQEDEGTYRCRASNRIGSVERHMQLIIQGKSGWNVTSIVIIIMLLVLFTGVLTAFIMKFRKEKKFRKNLILAGLANFEKGAPECLNPKLRVDDQAELLPYDKKWEFPREQLKLGKQLGSGAFGVVMEAEAFCIVRGEAITTVAVKMVKRNTDYTCIKALVSELKIMVHLGKHLNIVNLLGACTKNVAKRELLVIVEYCRYGNLHDYLLQHRDDFVNQIDPNTGNIDITIGAEMLASTLSVGSNESSSTSGSVASQNSNTTDSSAACTPCTPTGEDSLRVSSNSVTTNYRGDYKGSVRTISTEVLLSWAFQVARGMEYLASRKVLHGDLAARNILLAEDNIVKICDFGLAKNMYKSDHYKKQNAGPLPLKWMAVESIGDRVFSTQSDVWSYGIVLWEFFSLGTTPYPGMDADERLYNRLVDGYRMDQPEYSTKQIYEIMLKCWHAKPRSRPSFAHLAETLGCMLQESVRQHYVELNDPFLTVNTERLIDDYLLMLSPPDYVSDPLASEDPPGNSSPYLPLDVSSSPSNDLEVHHKNGDEVVGIELLPMLTNTDSEDTDQKFCKSQLSDPASGNQVN